MVGDRNGVPSMNTVWNVPNQLTIARLVLSVLCFVCLAFDWYLTRHWSCSRSPPAPIGSTASGPAGTARSRSSAAFSIRSPTRSSSAARLCFSPPCRRTIVRLDRLRKSRPGWPSSSSPASCWSRRCAASPKSRGPISRPSGPANGKWSSNVWPRRSSLWRLWYYDSTASHVPGRQTPPAGRPGRCDCWFGSPIALTIYSGWGYVQAAMSLAQEIGLRPAAQGLDHHARSAGRSVASRHHARTVCGQRRHVVVSVRPVAANGCILPYEPRRPVPWGWPAASVAFIIVVLMLLDGARSRLGGRSACRYRCVEGDRADPGLHVVPGCRRRRLPWRSRSSPRVPTGEISACRERFDAVAPRRWHRRHRLPGRDRAGVRHAGVAQFLRRAEPSRRTIRSSRCVEQASSVWILCWPRSVAVVLCPAVRRSRVPTVAARLAGEVGRRKSSAGELDQSSG